MNYVHFINKLIKEKVIEKDHIVLYGQNINAGSCLSGLTKKLEVKDNGLIINTPNSENTLTGIGFGLMINKVSSIFFMKQEDFLLLGVDHLVNTYNFIRRKNPSASFTIMFIVVDQGYQGLQSSHNSMSDFCSIARIPGFTLTNKEDSTQIINQHLISPGFRLIGVSQRMFNNEIIELPVIYSNKDKSLFQYEQGSDVTIACFNFSLPYGIELHKRLKEKKVHASLFTVNSLTPINWEKLLEDVKKTQKLIVIDDSKSENLLCYNLVMEAKGECDLKKHLIIKRDYPDSWLYPTLDNLDLNYDKIINALLEKEEK